MKIFVHKLLEELEGKRNEVYNDVAGLPTVGIGHLLTQDELSSGKIEIGNVTVKYWRGLSNDEIYDLLYQDLHRFESVVDVMVEVPLNFNQRTALVSFCFNVGMKAFINSTLFKVLNDRRYKDVPDQMRRWVYAGGKVSKGLINRRRREAEVWRTEVE